MSEEVDSGSRADAAASVGRQPAVFGEHALGMDLGGPDKHAVTIAAFEVPVALDLYKEGEGGGVRRYRTTHARTHPPMHCPTCRPVAMGGAVAGGCSGNPLCDGPAV